MRGLQDRGAFASPGESDSLAVVAGTLADYPKSSIASVCAVSAEAPALGAECQVESLLLCGVPSGSRVGGGV
jgi:hypothetical protein